MILLVSKYNSYPKWLRPFFYVFVLVIVSLTFGNTPSASSKPAVSAIVDGEKVFKTTVQINSHKPYWWIKSAGIYQFMKNRVCQEDKSKGKRFSKALLGEIHLTYPNLKGDNGLFDVTFVPKNTLPSFSDYTTCTYNARLFYRHGSKKYPVLNQFVIHLKEPDAAQPARPSVKTAPATAPPIPPKPKVFQPEDQPEPEKVDISEESKLALATPPKPVTKLITPQSSSTFQRGLEAYNQGKWESAAELLSKVPVPQTRRRGVPEREDYVKANFYKGLTLQHQGNLKEAATTYNLVLEYEKFYPVVNMNLGICYLELRQFAKAHKAFTRVIRDQNRIAPRQYDDVMQRTRYFWALAWTRLYRISTEPDRKSYYKRQAASKWIEYTTWFGDNPKYNKANQQAKFYISSLK